MENLQQALSCLERRVRELETAQAVAETKQQNLEEKLEKFTETATILVEKQSSKIDLLMRFMFVVTGVIAALQALGLLKR